MEVRFKQLKKSFDGRKVLDIDSGIIKSGSKTAIIGPNGAGKSTLLNIIAGLETPDSGSILYHDAATGDPAVCDDGTINAGKTAYFPQKEITMVFQKPYLLSTTVENNIAYPMKLRGFDDNTIERRTNELMEELHLTVFRKQKAWKLSGGETQKVALARALSFEPKLLLLDEPTANIDPATTAEIEKMLLSIGSRTTIVLITHNLAQAKRVCDEAIMLHDGRLIESGSCELLLTRPRMPETKQFVEGELLLSFH